jgi:hypothetical protein
VIYLTGCHNALTVKEAELGLMVQPHSYGLAQIEQYKGRWWAADNGCYSPSGRPFDEGAWWRWIWQVRKASQGWRRSTPSFCLFAVAPDVVSDPVGTYRRGWTRLYHLRRHGLPAAFVAQDGLENYPAVRRTDFWEDFDCLFLGGSTEWKLSEGAAWLAGEARARQRWVHMGRVNSLERLRHAIRIGCQSVDGTFLRFAPDLNIRRLRGWLAALHQLELPLAVPHVRSTESGAPMLPPQPRLERGPFGMAPEPRSCRWPPPSLGRP